MNIRITETDEDVVTEVPIRVLEEDNDVDGFQEAEEERREREALRFESERDRDR